MLQRSRQLFSYGRQLVADEVCVRSAQIAEQCLGAYSAVSLFRHISVDDEVHDGEEGVAVNLLLVAHLRHSLVAEAEAYAEGA